MSYLITLRKVLQGPAAGQRVLLLVLVAAVVAGGAWWLLAGHSTPSAANLQPQPSLLRRVRQSTTSAPPTPKLTISEVRQTGQVVEVKGTAQCDAAVMINGERVPLIFDGCGFKHFLLLPEGPSTIAVTAQGPAGGVNTQLIKVDVE